MQYVQAVIQTPFLLHMMNQEFRGWGAGTRLAKALGVSTAQACRIRNGEATNLEKLAAYYGYRIGDEPGEWIKSLTPVSPDSVGRVTPRAAS